MQTVRVILEEEFSDRMPGRESPFKTGRLAFNIYDFEPWQALAMRRHPHSDTVLLAIQGEGIMFMDDDSFSLEPGEAVYVPAGASYGLMAGDNDMVITATQGPAPVETEVAGGRTYRCPACGLETSLGAGTAPDALVVCPRCEARLRLKGPSGVEETGPPIFAEPPREAAGKPGAGGEMAPGERGVEIIDAEWVEAAGEPAGSRAGAEAGVEPGEGGRTARIAFSAFDFQPWQVLPMHQNPESDTILYIATGQGIMFLDAEEQSVDAGTAIYVPAGATYGLLAGDYDTIAVAVQCPVPVASRAFENLGYNCPVCDLGTPVTTNADSGCITVCPRCNVKLRLMRLADGFEAEETSEPAPASAETV
ncbi:MAG TPA: cupin domain-containing protein [Methanocella sp.]|nr:cupin domain-containing protein [Methanocella sp.]